MEPFIQTYTEQLFYYNHPEDYEYTIGEIAHCLASKCRYNGHVPFYSVAQHSLLMTEEAPPELKRATLMHDAAEAYIPDVPKHLKIKMPEFKKLETGILCAIFEWFNIPLTHINHPVIKKLDERILLDERKKLFQNQDYEWYLEEKIPLGVDINLTLSRQSWKVMFEVLFKKLTR